MQIAQPGPKGAGMHAALPARGTRVTPSEEDR
jgi:hypothetical protein